MEADVRKKLAEVQTTPTFYCRGYMAAAGITPWNGEKKSAMLLHAVPLMHHMKGIRRSHFVFVIFAVTAAATVSHLYHMYGITAFECCELMFYLWV